MNQRRADKRNIAMNDQTEQVVDQTSFQLINCQPKARSGTRAISYRDSLYFFGGYTRKGGTYFNDLFQYKVQEKQWYEIRQAAQNTAVIPEARTDHTFVRYKNRLYVYGGRDEVQIFKDIHEYSILSN